MHMSKCVHLLITASAKTAAVSLYTPPVLTALLVCVAKVPPSSQDQGGHHGPDVEAVAEVGR